MRYFRWVDQNICLSDNKFSNNIGPAQLENGNVYWIDANTGAEILKTEDGFVSRTMITSAGNFVGTPRQMWPDYSNNVLYVINSNGAGAGYSHYVYSINAADTVTELKTFSGNYDDTGVDVFRVASTNWTHYPKNTGGGSQNVHFYDITNSSEYTLARGASDGTTWNGPVLDISNHVYFQSYYGSNNRCQLYRFDTVVHSFEKMYDFAISSYIQTASPGMPMHWDGDDKIFMNLNTTVAHGNGFEGVFIISTQTWQQHSFSAAALTRTYSRYLDPDATLPEGQDHAWTYYYTRRLKWNFKNYYTKEEWDNSVNINGISADWGCGPDGSVFKFQNVANTHVFKCTTRTTSLKPSNAFLSTDLQLSDNATVDIHDDSGTLSFRGEAGVPKFTPRGRTFLRDYRMKGFEQKDFDKTFSVSYTSQNVDVIARDIINNQAQNAHLHASSTSIPAIAASMTIAFMDTRQEDALYALAIMGNATVHFDPSGLTHLRAWGSLKSSSLSFNKSTGDISFPQVEKVTQAVNYSKIWGGDFIESEIEVSENVLSIGRREWGGDDSFPFICCQATLSRLNQAIIDWQGNADNPVVATYKAVGKGHVQAGESLTLKFDLRDELNTKRTMVINMAEIDHKKNWAVIRSSENLVVR